MLTSTALVNLMTPGLAFFYGGLVRKRNVLTIMMQSIIAMGVVMCLWFVCGFSLSFGDSGGFAGSITNYPFFNNLSGFEVMSHGGNSDFKDKTEEAFVDGIPGLLFATYQAMFAIITPALITGAFADRLLFGPYLAYIIAWMFLIYFPVCHWVWGPDGFLGAWGVKDFAGGIVVHVTAGFSALSSVFVLGPRKASPGEDAANLDTPHNVPFVVLGTGLLWFGWFGFIGGSALAANGSAVYAAVNTQISASTALVVWSLLDWKFNGQPSLVDACVGAVAGLATITPAAGFVEPWGAFVIGMLAAMWCFGLAVARKKYKIDDALDVWSVHGMGGYLGTLCIGPFARANVGGVQASAKLFGKQLAAATGVAAYSFVVSAAILVALQRFMEIKPSDEQVEAGLDASLHRGNAYTGDHSTDLDFSALGITAMKPLKPTDVEVDHEPTKSA
jgi:Amt family ammonium transporter